MRNGKTLRQRFEVLELTGGDSDENTHDALDMLVRAGKEIEYLRTLGAETQHLLAEEELVVSRLRTEIRRLQGTEKRPC